ncbi:MAG: RnfABCDGE type electron transport complex subunit C [Thiolinea sp.]
MEARPIPHPSGLDDLCIILEADGSSSLFRNTPRLLQRWLITTIRMKIQLRRVSVKLVLSASAVRCFRRRSSMRRKCPICTLVVNGAECEPYITCDDRLMQDKADEIIAGALIMMHILRPHTPPDRELQCLIGIEDNKPEALAAMRAAAEHSGEARIRVVAVPTIYPAGGEKQLIKVLTGREVPSGQRPADIGMICHNVATARAIYRAVVLGEPLISRYVTVTGAGIDQPQNVEVPFGLPMARIIEAMGGYTAQAGQLVMGGPMMGISLSTDAIPVVKATNCILVNPPPPP